jgi:hypothetical protein
MYIFSAITIVKTPLSIPPATNTRFLVELLIIDFNDSLFAD